MASQEHQELATFIKSVHQSLRNRSKKIGAEKAWNEHCIQSETLHKYAEAMQTLAVKYWDENAKDSNKGAHSRVKWVMEKCVQYFTEDIKKEDFREDRAACKLLSSNSACENRNSCQVGEAAQVMPNIDLLDVGSCYNPFGVYPFFKVLPVDLAPATKDVYQCDFLNVHIRSKGSLKGMRHHHSVKELEEESFDVVVFSLMLEYLPSPAQRYICVTKAYSVLKPTGLLFIITPDSKHGSANAPLMKTWRLVLGELGFLRVYYEKLPHIHCMAYRKCRIPEVTKQWALQTRRRQGGQSFMVTHEMSPQGLYIPQDLQDKHDQSDDVTEAPVERTSFEKEELVEMFQCLPEEYI